jgi:succinoglycan biosynthesis transport protein ExoP
MNAPAETPGYGAYGAAPAAGDSSAWLRVMLEKLWLIVLVAVAGFFAAYGYLAHLPPIYQATGTLQIEPPREETSARTVEDDEPNLSTTEELNTLVQGLQRPAFLLEVANDPALQGDPLLFPPKDGGGAYTDQEKIAKVGGAVRVLLQKGTLLIFVVASHAQPGTAQRLCEAVLENFVKERMESKSGAEEETYQFLLSEAERLGRALADKEREIQKYDQLEKYDEQIAAQKAHIAELSQRYKEKFPTMIEARALLQSEQDAFDGEMERILKSDAEAGATPAVTVDPAVGITDDLRARMMGNYQVLKRDLETQRTLFASLSAEKNQSEVVRAAQAETAVKIGDHPVLPEQPISENPARILFIGTFLGAAVGIALAFLLEAMDRSIRTVDEAEALLDLPVLTAVPEIMRSTAKRKGKAPAHPLSYQLPILADRNSAPAEAIRSLRASMALIGAEEERRSVIFTSALPGEGKSFTAANYSIALASQELRTLLIDADLRRPSVHSIFGVERDHVGAVDYFLEKAPLAEFVTTTSLPNLDLLLSGTPAANPAELLSGRGFSRLIAEAMESYERIVVDTAPINLVSDTLMLIKAVQSVCVVVRAAASPSEAVLRAVRVLEKSGKRPVGIVFNRVPRRAELGYYRHYYYHYGSADKYGRAYEAVAT